MKTNIRKRGKTWMTISHGIVPLQCLLCSLLPWTGLENYFSNSNLGPDPCVRQVQWETLHHTDVFSFQMCFILVLVKTHGYPETGVL